MSARLTAALHWLRPSCAHEWLQCSHVLTQAGQTKTLTASEQRPTLAKTTPCARLPVGSID